MLPVLLVNILKRNRKATADVIYVSTVKRCKAVQEGGENEVDEETIRLA